MNQPNDLEKSKIQFIFDKYADAYAEKYMSVSLYADSLNFFVEKLEGQRSQVLDVGCGPGNITRYLLDLKPDLHIMGIDISENMLSIARKNNPEASFKLLDGRKISELDRKFDGIVAGFCLPYLSITELKEFVKHSQGKLKIGGFLYLSLMEDDYEKSGNIGSSSNPNEQLPTYFYQEKDLISLLNTVKLKIIYTERIENCNNNEGRKDLVIIAEK